MSVNAWGDRIRWYFIGGDDLPAVRSLYMDLVGRPPVPPKKAFGMWNSKFGYRSFAEAQDELEHLTNPKYRSNTAAPQDTLPSRRFPVDGLVYDVSFFFFFKKKIRFRTLT
jgi:alpha-glucosidase (family GH31 glycosyl hydrolase)